MAKKTKKKNNTKSKNSSNKMLKFYKSMSVDRKILFFGYVFIAIIATITLLIVSIQFKQSGWYTSNWIYVAYISLISSLIFVFVSGRSLYKISRLPILGLLLMIFIISGLLSVDFYKYYLDLTKTTETTNTTDTYKKPVIQNLPEAEQAPQTVESTAPASPNTTSNTDTSANDAWLKSYDERQKVEEAKYAEIRRCDDANIVAGKKYSTAVDKAKAAYDVVMAEWDSVKDLPYYQRNPYSEYAADAKAKHNAISSPAYTEYVNTLNSLKAQGCNIIQTHTDYSW